jgi:hypothetical protein
VQSVINREFFYEATCSNLFLLHRSTKKIRLRIILVRQDVGGLELQQQQQQQQQEK